MLPEPAVYRRPLSPDDGEPGIAPILSEKPDGLDSELDFRDYSIPDDRKLGVASTTLLIINRLVGTGIFSTPALVIVYTDSIGVSLIFWVVGGLVTVAGMFVYLEFGTAMPRSGGEKVYLERAFRRPRYLATAIFAVQFIVFAVSSGNALAFSSYLLRAINPHENRSTENTRSHTIVAGIAVTAVCLIHTFLPKVGIVVSNVLGGFKIVLLLLIIGTGFATLAGLTGARFEGNFTSLDGQGSIYNITDDVSKLPVDSVLIARHSIALNMIMYSYGGWENANYVLTEVKNPTRTLRIAAPLAVTTVTVLYFLANLAYFSAMSKVEIAESGIIIVATFFAKVFGHHFFVVRAIPLFVALSALGNIFAQCYAMPRVKQALAKEGFLLTSKFWASDWPCRTPSGALLLHWMFSLFFIILSRTGRSYSFVTEVFIYTGNYIKLMLAIGLLYLTLSPSQSAIWKAQRSSFHSSPIITIGWTLCLAYLLIVPWIPHPPFHANDIKWYVIPSIGSGMVVIGALYWSIWAKLLPALGFKIMHEVEILPDGSERVRYVRMTPWATARLDKLRHAVAPVVSDGWEWTRPTMTTRPRHHRTYNPSLPSSACNDGSYSAAAHVHTLSDHTKHGNVHQRHHINEPSSLGTGVMDRLGAAPAWREVVEENAKRKQAT